MLAFLDLTNFIILLSKEKNHKFLWLIGSSMLYVVKNRFSKHINFLVLKWGGNRGMIVLYLSAQLAVLYTYNCLLIMIYFRLGRNLLIINKYAVRSRYSSWQGTNATGKLIAVAYTLCVHIETSSLWSEFVNKNSI